MSTANKGRAKSKPIHSEKVCTQCEKCGSRKTGRWYHKINKSEEFHHWLYSTFNLSPESCICNACNLELEKVFGGQPPAKKVKVDPCQICSDLAVHRIFITDLTNFLDLMNVPITESKKLVDFENEVHLCPAHYEKWRELRFFNATCSLPDCQERIRSPSCIRYIPYFQTLHNFFSQTDDEAYSSLKEDSIVCRPCNTQLSKLAKTLQMSRQDFESEVPTTLQEKIKDYEDHILRSTVDNSNIEMLSLTETYLYVARNLIVKKPMLLSQILNLFKDKTRAASSNHDISETVLSKCKSRGSVWLRVRLTQEFGWVATFNLYSKDGVLNKKKSILILHKNCDVLSCLHDTYIQNISLEKIFGHQQKPLPTIEETNTTSLAYFTVLNDLFLRYQKQIEDFKDKYNDTDLCKVNFLDVAKSIDPFIWNFHYLASQSKNERKHQKYISSLDRQFFPESHDSSSHSRTRVLRTLFSICHTLFQVSKGECANPLHIILSDTADTYSGSSKLSSIFNSFGILSSKSKAREHIQTIVEEKISTKFLEDLPENTFTIISIDNIDIGQPYASVKLNDSQRGIHATSYQAVQPKPLSLVGETTANFDFNSSPKLSVDSFLVNDIEQSVLDETRENMFEFILQKNSIEDSDICMPDLKTYLAQFQIKENEKSNVVYLGILNEPCDNKETIKHVLELIHDNFGIDISKTHMLIVGDAKTYDILNKLKNEYSEELSWVLPFPGDWHVLKNVQPVLFKVYFEAGLKEIAKLTHKEDGLLTVLQQCSNFKKTHSFLMNMWECFYRAELASFFEFRGSKSDLSSFACQILSDVIFQELKQFVLTTNSFSTKTESLSQLQETRTKVKTELQMSLLQQDFKTFCIEMCKKDDTFKFWHHFIHRDCFSYISLYLSFRSSNWHLRLGSLKNLSPLFHAFDRHIYLRLIPNHLADLCKLPQNCSELLASGGFSASFTGNAWQHLALDEAHECKINRDVKEAVRKPSPDLLDTMAVYLPYRASLQKNICEQLLINNQITEKGLSKSKQLDEKALCCHYLQKIIESQVFQLNNHTNRGLIRLFTTEVADFNIHYDLMNFYEIGQKSMNDFVSSRILHLPSTDAPVRKKTLRTFAPTKGKKSTRKSSDAKEKTLYSRCIKKEMAYSMQSGKPLNKFHQYIPLPRAICMTDGTMHHQDTKANATRTLSCRYDGLFIDSILTGFQPNLVILEGMFIINSAPIRSHHKTFSDLLLYLVRRWVIPHLKSNVNEIQILFDKSPSSTEGTACLKDLERSRRDKNEPNVAKTVVFIDKTSDLPKGKWVEFLRNRENKAKYIELISKELLEIVQPYLKYHQICVIGGCFANGSTCGIRHEGCRFELKNKISNHDETDTLIWATVNNTEEKHVLIYSPDTDVYFIGLSHAMKVVQDKTIIVQQNMLGDNQKFLKFNKLVDCLVRDPDLASIPSEHICKCIQVIYICSGCDYISFFVGFGKAFFFNTFFQYCPFISGSLMEVQGQLWVTSNTDEQNGFLSFVRLIGCMYFRKHASEFIPDSSSPSDLFKHFLQKYHTLSQREIHKLWLDFIRDKVQVRSSYEDEIPPSLTALEYHWKRTCLVSRMYDLSNLLMIHLPCLTNYGYSMEDGKLKPIWDDADHIKTVQHHVDWLLRGCKCKKGCIKNTCKCKKNERRCGPGCSCLHCQNMEANGHAGVEIEIEEGNSLQPYMSSSDSEVDEHST